MFAARQCFQLNSLRKTYINSWQIIRTVTTPTNQQVLDKFVADTDTWSPIYKLPIISWAAALNKLKLYQGGFTAVGIPFCLAMEASNYMTDNSTLIFAAIGVTGLTTLSLASLVLKNLIGIIYIHKSLEIIKCSYIDFWGRRKDIELDVNEIIPFAEQQTKKWQFYQIITTDRANIRLKLIHRFAHISDRDSFISIFGD